MTIVIIQIETIHCQYILYNNKKNNNNKNEGSCMQSYNNKNIQDRIKKIAFEFGNKAANLIELEQLCKSIPTSDIHVQIPSIFPLSDSSMKSHLDLHASEWRKLWDLFVTEQTGKKKLTHESKKIIQQLQTLMRNCFQKNPIKTEEISSNPLPTDTMFMVRSTGEEDTSEMANPGGNKSIAAVEPESKAVSAAIGDVIASYVSKKSLTQRLLSGDDITKPPFMPVLIQSMVGEKLNGEENPENILVSGVMYAKSAMTRIEAAFGHGELIVNSKAPFDIYDMTRYQNIHAEIHQKPNRLIPIETKNSHNILKRKLVFKDNPQPLQNKSTLEPEIAKAIALVGQSIRQHYGMPMDIEFVYHPKEKKLFIVQARPIPEPRQKIKPSAISNEHWLKMQKDLSSIKLPATVITPAGKAAKIIKKNDEIIVANNIGMALKEYLADTEKKQNVHAIVVNEEAPSTSHEAAIFNSLSIPVLQTNIEPILKVTKESDTLVIVDPQRQHIVINKKTEENNEQKIIAEGLFASVLNPIKTLLSFNKEPSEPIKKTIQEYLAIKANEFDIKSVYQQLLGQLKNLETTSIDDDNIEIFASLKKIAAIFLRLATSTNAKDKKKPHQALLVHAMHSIAEIHLCLTEYGKIKKSMGMEITKQEELLDLISKLKALVVSTRQSGLFSDSIKQISLDNYENKRSNIEGLNLSNTRKEIAGELLKLGTLALNSITKDKWEKFVINCSASNLSQQKLAKIVLFASQNNLQSEFINNYFINAYTTSEINALDALCKEVSGAIAIFQKHPIHEYQKIIASFEKRIPEWSQPSKFTRLYQDFEQELIPLIDKLSIEDTMPNIAKSAILRCVQNLTDIMDKTIKSLKGSPEYTENDTEVLIKRFYKLLTSYHRLMEKWMKAIPEDFYEKCRREIVEKYYNSKSGMIDVIREIFESKNEIYDKVQLQPSNYFSVISAKVGTTASIQRQMVNKKHRMTLEDLFTLFHQNTLAATQILGKEVGMNIKGMHLPEKLQPFIAALESVENIDLLQISHQHPSLKLTYNLPLKNHSAEIVVEYDIGKDQLQLHWKFFGGNWDNRMDMISSISILECLLLKGRTTKIPQFNEQTLSLEFTWEFKEFSHNNLSQNIQKIITDYAEYTHTHEDPILIMRILARYNNVYKILNTVTPKLLEDLTEEIITFLQKYPENLSEYFFKYIKNKNLTTLKGFINSIPLSYFENVLYSTNAEEESSLIYAIYNSTPEIIEYLKGLDSQKKFATMKNKDNESYLEIEKKLEIFTYVQKKEYKKVLEILNEDKTFTLESTHKALNKSLKTILSDQFYTMVTDGDLETLKAMRTALSNEIFAEIMLTQNTSCKDSGLIWAAYVRNYDIVDWLLEIDVDNRLRLLKNERENDYLHYLKINLSSLLKSSNYSKAQSLVSKYQLTLHPDDVLLLKNRILNHIQNENLQKLTEMLEAFPQFLDDLLQHKDSENNTAISLALKNKNNNIIEYMIKKDCLKKLNLSTLDEDSQKVYQYACELVKLADESNYAEINLRLPNYESSVKSELKEILESFKCTIHRQAITAAKDNDAKKLETILEYFFPRLANEILFKKNENHTILTIAAFHGATKVIDFALKHHPNLAETKDDSGNTYLDNLGLHLIALAKDEKYEEIASLRDLYPKLSLVVKNKNDDTITSILANQLIKYIDEGNYNQFKKCIRLLPIESFPPKTITDILGRQIIDYIIKGQMNDLEDLEKLLPMIAFPNIYLFKTADGNSPLIWSAYMGYLNFFDRLLQLDPDKKLRHEKSNYGFDAIDNLSILVVKFLNKKQFADAGYVLNKYKDIPLDVIDTYSKESIKSSLRKQFTELVEKGLVLQLKEMKLGLPEKVFNDMLKDKIEDVALIDKMKSKTLTAETRTWLESLTQSSLPSAMFFSTAKKPEDLTEITKTKPNTI